MYEIYNVRFDLCNNRKCPIYNNNLLALLQLLTTYQRNRKAIGEMAVSLLDEKLRTGRYSGFEPPKGKLIHGDTCPGGADNADIKNEIKAAQVKATYDFLNLFSQLEHRLTECSNIDEFVARCWDFQFMIRGVNRLYMCLYENWYDDSENSENMVCYNLLTHEEPLIFRKNNISAVFRDEAAPYYFSPLFFADRELGFVVLRFSVPDTFDHIYRNRLKSIANGLEFLRMKNDIQYLIKCQSLFEQRDTLTGMPIHMECMVLNGATIIDGPELVWQDDFRETGYNDSEGYRCRGWETRTSTTILRSHSSARSLTELYVYPHVRRS